MPSGPPNLTHSSAICVASSRVGASTSTRGAFGCPGIGPGLLPQSCLNAGTRKPSVLPLPVFATPMTSDPASAGGQAWPWIAEGVAKPAELSDARSRSGSGASSNLA